VELADVLEEAKALGFLGPGPVAEHLAHAEALAGHLPPGVARLLDLGSGGGVPGLALACARPEIHVALLEGGERRASFLRSAVAQLGLGARCTVIAIRAEVAGHDPALRATFDCVTARSFAAPAVTAECGAAFLRLGGHLVVSEPPELDPARWPAAGLAELGLGHVTHVGAGPRFALLELVGACPERFPRRTGVPTRRPLW
jgi:16S rRNA (guanine527-N7)-methyltransferase